jgi:inorganic pyrophosphatase
MAKKAARRRTQSTSLDRLAPFEEEQLIVVIETPKGSANKLAYEPRYGTFVLKHVLPAGAIFPFDFGFVPSTRADDGDPLDVLVLMDAPVFPGCVVQSRVIGVLEAEQTENGKTERNDRLVAVAANSAALRSTVELNGLSADLIAQIEHFFVSYNDARGKRFEVKKRSGKDRALALIKAAMKRGRR